MNDAVVLIIDDDDAFRNLSGVILRRAGYQVMMAHNGETGLALAKAEPPALVIVDDMMPGMSGGEVCQQMRRDPALAHLPILMYSAGVRVRNRAYLEEIGVTRGLVKPVPPKELIAVIAELVGAPA